MLQPPTIFSFLAKILATKPIPPRQKMGRSFSGKCDKPKRPGDYQTQLKQDRAIVKAVVQNKIMRHKIMRKLRKASNMEDQKQNKQWGKKSRRKRLFKVFLDLETFLKSVISLETQEKLSYP